MATDFRTRRGLDERRSSSRGPMEALQKSQAKGAVKEKTGQRNTLDGWVEPALAAPKPSYQDHGAGPYGVLEHMQALGEAPNAKVKARVKTEGARKSVLGRSSAAVGLDAQETPEGTPAPATPQPPEVPTQTAVIVDDDRDTDYAPNMNGKKRERSTRARAVKRKSESASSATPAAPAIKADDNASATNHNFIYSDQQLHRVVEAAQARAHEAGKPDIAAAVYAVYQQSLKNAPLRMLIEAVLLQRATTEQNAEFQTYIRAAKKKVKEQRKFDSPARHHPHANTNGAIHKLPSTSPKINITLPPQPPPPSEPASAIPSTERPEPSKLKLSLKVKSPSKDPNRRRTGNGMSVSPRKRERAGSAGSDSSLTSLTSNEDDNEMDLDEAGESNSGLRTNGVRGKDHAAERGSLQVPGGVTKRNSAEAELEEERDRAFAAKKQRLNESVAREYDWSESNVRPTRPPPRSRAAALKLQAPGSRNASFRGSRAVSMDVESPLSELSPATSRQSTPHAWKAPAKPAGKRAKTKTSPEKKQLAAYGGASGVGGGRESPIGDDDNDVLSENNDFCSACHSSGYLLCCDGCDRAFHFTCLDPPLSEDSQELDEPWFCNICVSKRPVVQRSPEKAKGGLFGPLFSSLQKRNPTNFALPQDVRELYEGVATDKNGSFVEVSNVAAKPTRNRPGYTEEKLDYKRLRDNKGNLIQCYQCGKTSEGKRDIITCDFCPQHWHLDCLDPPLANPPALNQNGRKAHDWMCPLHADQEMRKVPISNLTRHHQERTIHVRKQKNARIQETALPRGHRNNGIIEVVEDESDASDSEFYDHDDGGTIYKLPALGIKLDFIDKVKNTRIQQLRDERAHARARKRARLSDEAPMPAALEQANFAKRPFNEQQLALNLAQFANDNTDLELGGDQVQNLVGTLIAEAPSDVVDKMMAAEDAEKAKSASSNVPPSPPSSEQTDQLNAEQRKELLMLQELIRRKLENSKT